MENCTNFTMKPFIFIMAVAILCQARLIENHLVMSDCSIIIMCVIDNSIDAYSISKIVWFPIPSSQLRCLRRTFLSMLCSLLGSKDCEPPSNCSCCWFWGHCSFGNNFDLTIKPFFSKADADVVEAFVVPADVRLWRNRGFSSLLCCRSCFCFILHCLWQLYVLPAFYFDQGLLFPTFWSIFFESEICASYISL